MFAFQSAKWYDLVDLTNKRNRILCFKFQDEGTQCNKTQKMR
jgi:hypothetical protein